MFLLAKLTTSAGAWPGPNGGSAPARGTSAGSLVPEAREPALTTCLKEAGFCYVGLARAGGWTCRAELPRAARSGGRQPRREKRCSPADSGRTNSGSGARVEGGMFPRTRPPAAAAQMLALTAFVIVAPIGAM